MTQAIQKEPTRKSDPYQTLKHYIDCFENLNPDFSTEELAEAYSAAESLDPEHFAEFAARAEDIIGTYLGASHKRVERLILADYFRCIDASTRLLGDGGRTEPEEHTVPSGAESMALVHSYKLTPLERCRILSGAHMRKELVLAVDACKRHNQLVTSVVEYLFVILQEIDFERAVEWQLAFLERQTGKLDADVVRDLLLAWLQADLEALPRQALTWVESWCADENLLDQWPGVITSGDRVLRARSLQEWSKDPQDRSRNATHLRLLLKRDPLAEKPLLRWLEASINELGRSVRFFVSLSQQTPEAAAEDRDWQQAALVREIKRVGALFVPVLVTADLVSTVPDGAARFALAFFGLVGEGRKEWYEDQLRAARLKIRKAFVDGVKNDESPGSVIHTLCFGDRDMELKLMAELDWISKRFDSIKQREKVVSQLAIYYASYLEPEALADEVARRYRDLMRVLHEDNLRRALTPEQYDEISQASVLRDLAALAGNARRFLSRRRALKTTVEEMVSAQTEFVLSVRRRRLNCIHELLGPQKT